MRVRPLPSSRARRLLLLFTIALGLALVKGSLGEPQAQGCDPSLQNEIVCENLLPGAPSSEWQVTGAGASSIQGFATDISVNRGSTVRFKIDTDAAAYRIDIYRLGFYAGMGARKVATINPSAALPQNQPNCLSNANTGLVDCGNWGVSASWAVPATAVSGLYIARPVRTDTGGASHIPFVVRDDAGASELLFQTSDTTWQAYNQYGGNSLYVGSSGVASDRAVKVSYNRPFTTRATSPEDWIFNAEYPMIRWLEANGYDVSYTSGIDTDRAGAELQEHRAFLSVGHDEYWSGAQRANVEAARNATPPVHLAFFSGNEIYWKTRWEPSIDGSGTPYRTLVSYKETHANSKIDPAVDPVTGAPIWTGTWRDMRFSPPGDARPENALAGTWFRVNAGTSAISVPVAFNKHRFWRNTTIATATSTVNLPAGTLGYEWDEAPENALTPPGMMKLSQRTVSGVDILLDLGNTFGGGTATHNMTLYRHSSGALVFGAGTVQWSWGLDANHDRGTAAADTRMRQATVNLFADMNVLPRTIQSGLVVTSPSSDTLAPTSTITAPAPGAAINPGSSVTISGTAVENGGGIITVVEVSTDGGTTWRRATGTTAWTLTWNANTAGSTTILSRAWDDTGNREIPGSGVAVTVGGEGGGSGACPCTIWSPSDVPAMMEVDPNAIEVGTRFRAATDGVITGIRFYKYAQNTGTHTGNLWTNAGVKLGTVTFANETASGWQQANFATPIAITAGTTYVVSYHTPSGNYAVNSPYFATDVNNPPLRALFDGEDGANGVYRYGATSGFPTDTFGASNYWVDVVFLNSSEPDTTAPTVTATSPAGGATNVAANTLVTATFSESVNPETVTGSTFELRDPTNAIVPAAVTYDAATRRATLDPAANLLTSTTYTARIRGGAADPRVKDQAGNALAQDLFWTFTTSATPPASDNCPCTIWAPSTLPDRQDSDRSAVEIGVRFRSSTAGFITGVRFYKYSTNTGTHVGNLWSSTGTRLATATFTNETGSGWQQVLFATPVAINANTTYVASYHTTVGGYAVSSNYFANAVTRGPLTALRDGTDGGNGLYRYGASSTAMPNSTFQSENYWVDVVFVSSFGPDTTPPGVVSAIPAAGRSGVNISTSISATFDEALTASTVNANTFLLRTQAGAPVAATVSYNSSTLTATLTPSAPLAHSTTYRAILKGGATDPRVKDAIGNAMTSDYTWTFTTAAPPPPPPDQGPGGPILVVAGSANPFGKYVAEILRTEGLNAFAVADLASVSAATLANFDVVILGETPLTDAQVTTLTNWVTAGGNLVAMRPDKKLASLLGLVDAGTTLANGYVLINNATEPGAGLVNQTIQFHGTADRYTAAGATVIATLYSNATTATTNPAVTLRSVGTSGGQAAAFTFDLARSIVYTRQGNPAWAGQERDGLAPVRSDDLFFGARSGDVQADWINLSKVAIPQADEQQRLLAQLILHVNADRKPLPRFWYLPRMERAAIVMTGDDHANGGTPGRFEVQKSQSPPGCSVDDWECVRSTSYIYPHTPMTNAAAVAYEAQGFEIALHPETACSNYTAASLQQAISTQLANLAANFPGITPPMSNRTHCLVWSDWFSQVTVQANNGIRFDENYYYYPGSWIQNRPGMFTGSGWPMRFADTTGAMTDVYQAATQMTDESGQTYPMTINSLLDRAIGPEGYYGVFSANMHTDFGEHGDQDAIVASAQARGVPIVSARQMLQWLDGRNGSSFRNLVFSGGVLSFSIDVGANANGLRAMLPTTTAAGSALTGIQRNGAAIAHTVETIKGVEYAIFPAEAGSYAAAYGVDATPPVISGVLSSPTAGGTAAISWTTSEAADSRVDYGTSAGALTLVQSDPALVTAHSLTLTGLAPNTTYFYRVRSADSAGNAASSPGTLDPPASFVTPAPGLSIANATATEGTGAAGGELRFTVTMSPASAQSVTVEYGTIDGTAVGGADYVAQGATLTFAPGVTSQTIVVPLAGDSLDEPNESVLVVLSSPTNATITSPQATGTITDDDAAPSLSVGNLSIAEGNAGITNATFTVSLSAASGQAVSVAYATANGTAAAPGDYTVTSGTLTFAPGSTSQTVVVAVIADGLDENDETFQLNLSNATNATVAAGQGIGTIADDDVSPSISIADQAFNEGNAGTTTATFALTLSAASGRAVTVGYATADGSGLAGSDYGAASGTATFAIGSTTATVTVAVTADTVIEPDETFVLNLSAPSGATLARTQATGTIIDDDSIPSLSLGNVSVVEGNAGTTNAIFTVSLSEASNQSVSVAYATANVTAAAPGDYTSRSGTLTFAPGVTSQTVTVPVIGDTSDENDETLQVNLTNPTNAALGVAQGVGTIVNDDPQPAISVADVSLNEGNAGTSTATFVLTLSTASGRVVTVNYATANGSAAAGSDYTAATGTATFAAGSTTTNVTVSVSGDTVMEPDETFLLSLTAPANATLARAQATATIVNDEGVPAISIADASVTEGNSGTVNLNFAVTLSAASLSDVSVSYATGGGTATAGTDYTAASGTLTIPSGSTSGTITVVVTGDTSSEPGETLTLTLSNPLNATLARSAATGTIANDDASSGLVAAYNFNEGTGTSVADSSGNELTGAISGATWAAGRTGNGLSFDGVNDWVTVNDADVLDATRVTVSAWVRPTVNTPWTTVVMKETAGGLAYALYANNGASRPAGYVQIGGVDRVATGTAVVPTNAWTHLAYTYDGASMRMYVNGVLVRTVARTGNIVVSTGPLRIGGNAGWGEYFTGLIDDVRVYNRALSLAEVQADMNTPVP